MDWRELRVYVLGMPLTGTALARSIHGTEAGDWTSTDELLRWLASIAQEQLWAFFEVNRDHKAQPKASPRPEPIPSPFDPKPDDDRDADTGKRPVTSAADTFRKLSRLLDTPD